MAKISGTVNQDGTPVGGIKVTAVTDTANPGEIWTPNTSVSLGDRVHSAQDEIPDILKADHPDLISFWKMENLDLIDETTTGNDGSVGGGNPTIESGQLGNSIRFDGNGDYLSFPHISPYSNDVIFFSFFANHISDGSNIKGILYKGATTAPEDREFHIGFNSNRSVGVSLGISDGNFLDVDSTYIAANSEIVHIAATYDRTGSQATIKLWVNGTYEGFANTGSFSASKGSRPIQFGRLAENSQSARYLNGIVDEVRIFNRELTQEEITTLANEVSDLSKYVFDCTTAGTTGSTEPTWKTSGTTNDGSAVWTTKDYTPDSVVAETITDSNGDYTLTGLDSTPVVVTAREDRGIAWPASTAVNLGDRVYGTGESDTDILKSDHPDLVAFYKLDSTDIVDSSGNQADGTASNVTVENGGLRFSSSNSSVDTGVVGAALIPSTHSFSMQVYLYSYPSASFEHQVLFSSRNSGPGSGGVFHQFVAANVEVAGTFRAHISSPSSGLRSVDSAVLFPLETWTTIFVEYDGTLRLFFDDVEQGSDTFSGISHTGNSFLIGNGRYNDGTHYDSAPNMIVKNCRIFNRILTAEEKAVVSYGSQLRGYVFDCTTAGTTGATEPTWNTTGTTNDGTAVWTAKPYFRPVSHGPIIVGE